MHTAYLDKTVDVACQFQHSRSDRQLEHHPKRNDVNACLMSVLRVTVMLVLIYVLMVQRTILLVDLGSDDIMTSYNIT